MRKHHNSAKDKRLRNFPTESIDSDIEKIEGLLSFNFRYLDSEQGDRFSDLTPNQFGKIMEKLKYYSGESRQHWEQERIGNKNSKVLVVYGDFPNNSDFHHPKGVPAGVRWARFRLEGDQRLAGFVINKNDVSEDSNLNTNVFYVVFLDNQHRFYKVKK